MIYNELTVFFDQILIYISCLIFFYIYISIDWNNTNIKHNRNLNNTSMQYSVLNKKLIFYKNCSVFFIQNFPKLSLIFLRKILFCLISFEKVTNTVILKIRLLLFLKKIAFNQVEYKTIHKNHRPKVNINFCKSHF